MLHAPELLQRLDGLRLGRPLYLFQEIGSTNDYAKRLAEGGAPAGALVLAEAQTHGRGRAGRDWLTPPGSALALSLILRPALPAVQAARLVMLAGVAACAALAQAAGLRAALKWPNDVLISGKKVAGILVETALRGETLDYAVLGLGLNVRWSPAPEQVDFPATHVEAEAGRAVERERLLYALLAQLDAHYPALLSGAIFEDWRARLTMLDTPIELRTEAETLAGRAEGVTPEGALIFRAASGEVREVLAGDVRLRRSD
jgi:BirA family biotin operon repressor/biotin-[acetyl-CoA-carboxylase] ligase